MVSRTPGDALAIFPEPETIGQLIDRSQSQERLLRRLLRLTLEARREQRRLAHNERRPAAGGAA